MLLIIDHWEWLLLFLAIWWTVLSSTIFRQTKFIVFTVRLFPFFDRLNFLFVLIHRKVDVLRAKPSLNTDTTDQHLSPVNNNRRSQFAPVLSSTPVHQISPNMPISVDLTCEIEIFSLKTNDLFSFSSSYTIGSTGFNTEFSRSTSCTTVSYCSTTSKCWSTTTYST